MSDVEADRESIDDPDELKIFCIGAGKTGTTSLEAFFRSLGLRLGDQETGELLLRDWAAGNFAPIIALARSAQCFQDMPFSCPKTYQALDTAFPNAKFILSVRDDPEQWYASLTRFHTKLLGLGRLPTAADLAAFPYRYKGWILEAMKLVFGVTDEEPYRKDVLINSYERHNAEVRKYFMPRRASLLVASLSAPDTAQRIMEFIGRPYRGEQIPHLNRASDAL